jgi:SAM-dependent methyltransferase
VTAFALPREFAATPGLQEIATEPVGICAVCGGGEFAVIARGADYELQTCANEWIFRQCADCGHVQLDPRPAVAALPVIYPAHYYSYDMEKSVGRVALAGKAFLDRRKFARILDLLGRSPGAYLDVGCGDLKYLELMRGFGVSPDRLYGLELDDRVVERARRRGFRVFAERVEASDAIPHGAIDFATMFHVIEHVADPGAVIRKIASWLTPGGVLALETPNFDSLDARLFRSKYWGGYHIPRHWHIFTRRSLATLLEGNGFAVEAISYQPGHSFWLYSLHHLLRYNRILPMPRLAQLFHPLKSLPMLVLATGFDVIRAKLGFRTSAMLFIARRRPVS